MYLLLALCAVAAAVDPQLIPSGKTRYDNYQVLAITPQNKLAVRFVHSLSEDLELDMWKPTPFIGDDAHLMIPPHRLEEIKTRLTKRNIPFSVYIENVQEGLDEEEASLKKNVKVFDYDQYNTLADIYTEIDRLAANCPTGYTCGTEDIGTTTEGRALTLLKIEGSGSGRGKIWIDSTIHAREWLAPATVFRFIRRIWNGDSLLDNYDFYFLPMMNPDGYEYTWTTSRMWRKNREVNSGSSCIGTDLNRNYATNWGISGASTNPCSDTYRGSSAGSCLETIAVQNYLGSGNGFGSTLDAFVSVHTYGNYWLHAWGHQQGGQCVIADDHDDLFAVANAAADAAAAAESDNNSWRRGNSCATIYPASGLTLEYAKDPGGCKYTYTPELRGGSFSPPASAIPPSDNEFYAAIVAQMAKIEEIQGSR